MIDRETELAVGVASAHYESSSDTLFCMRALLHGLCSKVAHRQLWLNAMTLVWLTASAQAAHLPDSHLRVFDAEGVERTGDTSFSARGTQNTRAT